MDDAVQLRERVRGLRDDFVDFVSTLCRIESPTEDHASQSDVHAVLGPALRELGFEVRVIPGAVSGSHLLALPEGRRRHGPIQLLVGHTDTVWPSGTLASMPVHLDDGRLHGPGSLDMKGGLTQIVFALRALRIVERSPEVTPVIFINSDEEVGSPDSKRHVVRLAKAAARAFVVEPALGPEGLVKTARKGVARFEVAVRGRAAHAGLDPESGASAVLELAHVVLALDRLNDPDRGTTVNVGVVEGGTRANVVAARARGLVDVRVVTAEEGRRVEERIRALTPTTPGVTLEIEGGVQTPPLQRTSRNVRLWEDARRAGARMGLALADAMAGGGSDGNTTSLFTATLDGLGCVGDGAHAAHEHIDVDASLDRCALLAELMMLPADPRDGRA